MYGTAMPDISLDLQAGAVIVAAASAGNAPRRRGCPARAIGPGMTMTVRTRKLIGAVVLLLFLAVYALLAMFIAIVLQVSASKWIELAYYVVAGVAWVIPAGWLVRWMERPETPSPPSAPGSKS